MNKHVTHQIMSSIISNPSVAVNVVDGSLVFNIPTLGENVKDGNKDYSFDQLYDLIKKDLHAHEE